MIVIGQEDFPAAKVRQVYLIQGDLIDHYMPHILSGLKAVPRYYDFYDEQWTYEEIKTGRLLVWALSDGVIRGIVLSRILVYPKQKVFSILAIYGIGMLDFFNEMQDTFMYVAQEMGCKTISAQCRPALKRLLKGFAAETEAFVMYRDIPTIGDQ